MAQVLTAIGPSAPFAITRTTGAQSSNLPPSILCLASGTVTYNIEVTGDTPASVSPSPANPSVFPPNAVWFPMDASTVGLTASQNETISAEVTGIRVNVTALSAGASVTFEVVQ